MITTTMAPKEYDFRVDKNGNVKLVYFIYKVSMKIVYNPRLALVLMVKYL